MKARLAVGLVALAALAVAIPLWDGGDPVPHYQGYVTGDFVHVGPVESGRVDRLAVERGSKVAKGDPLFGLDTKVYRAERDQAVARLRRAEAQLAKLRAPRQQAEEIDVLEAREEQAEAALAHSEKELDRQRRLRSRDVSSAAAYDKALARYRRDRAAMKEIRRQIRLGKMPARAQNIEAAIAAREDARAALNRARERLERRRTAAPSRSEDRPPSQTSSCPSPRHRRTTVTRARTT